MSITKRYAAYIETPGWAAKAQAAKQRAGQKCQLCGAKRKDVQLHAHHNTYQRLGREKNTDLLVLCEPCHSKHHDKLPKPDAEQLPLNGTNGAVDAIENVVNAVTLPKWDTMSDEDKIEEAKRLCAAMEEKMEVQPPRVAEKVAERVGISSSSYGNYRRGLAIIRHVNHRTGYRCVREAIAHYLNTGEIKQPELPNYKQAQRIATRKKQEEEKAAAAEKRLADFDRRINANKTWRSRCYNLNLELKQQTENQRERLDTAISESARIDKRIDFIDTANNLRCDHQDELIIALQQRLDGLAKANKHLLEKLEATTKPTPDATTQVELGQWWRRLWSR